MGSAGREAGGERSGAAGGKVASLAEAVRRHIRPGQVIQAGSGWGFPTALLYEIVRQYWGQDPGFTLVVAGAGSTNVVPFLRGRLLRRVVSSFAGDGYPHPGPNEVIQEARRHWAEAPGAPGAVEFEDWSLLTFTLRLLAGAMGLPFLPTRSLVGSDLGRDLEAAGLFRTVADPFAAGQGTGEGPAPLGLVKALRPDVSLAHAWAADPDGNALFTLPLATNVYGALAAREGVILSAERIVDRAYLAARSDLVRLPGYRVLAVVEAPFGAHPTGLHHWGVREGAGPAAAPPGGGAATRRATTQGATIPRNGYAEDREFILELRAACAQPETIDAWIRRWILDLPDHQAYLAQLGRERLAGLERRLAGEAWRDDFPPGWSEAGGVSTRPDGVPGEPDYLSAPLTPPERLIALASTVVAEEVRRGGYASVLAGVGAAHLACWLAREELAAEGRAVELMAETGLVGHRPYPGDPFVFALRNVPTALLTTDVLTVLGMLVPEWGNADPAGSAGAPGGGTGCLGVIGAAQVDRYGNVNSSGIPAAGMWLVGSGGANDVASTAAAVIVVAAQSPTRFVPEVPYVTSPGGRVTAIVSQWGVFRRLEPAGEFALAAYYDDPAEPGPEAGIRRAREKCGWDLRIPANPLPLSPAGPDVVRRLRLFDPAGHFRR